MRPRLTGIAALLMIGAPALAQTDKPDPSKAAPQEQHPKALILASADVARSPAQAVHQSPELAKKRIEPRTTTCRCGDPQVEADPDNEDQ